MNNTLKSILKYLIFLGLGGGLLYLALKDIDFEKLMEDFAQAKYEYVIASMVMGYLAFISRGLRWNLLLDPLGQKAKPWNAIHAIAVGYFANVAVPRAGELARCTALHSTDKIPVNRLFGTVMLERTIDAFMLLSLMLLTVILEFNNFTAFFTEAFSNQTPEEANNSWIWKLAIVLIVLVGLVLLYRVRERFKTLPFYAKVREFWNGFKEGFKALGQLKSKWSFIAHTLFIWLMYYLMIYVVFFALPVTENIDPSSGLFIMIVGGLGMVIPAPGGIGSYHYLVMLGMGVLGISATDGVSFATLVHSGQLVMTILAGLLAFLFIYLEKRKNSAANDA